jgi:anthranilate synthase/aminodeoxychorismate synthase-like glutamine amidotransferase
MNGAAGGKGEGGVIVVIDNYDSFTYNLVQYLCTLGAAVEVHRNDAISVDALAAKPLEGLVISPGPGQPRDAGITEPAIRKLGGRVPVLGVCLGHQGLAEVYGGRVVRAQRLMHGKTSPILHRGRGLFAGLDNPFEATRYHSLIVERDSLPAVLDLVAWTPEGEVMGLKHREHETWGVQFHPESILTLSGMKLIENFLTLCRQQRSVTR